MSRLEPMRRHVVFCADVYPLDHVLLEDRQGIWSNSTAFETAQVCEHLVRKFLFEGSQDDMPHVSAAPPGFRVQVHV